MFSPTQARQVVKFVVQRWLTAIDAPTLLVDGLVVALALVVFAGGIAGAALILMLLWPVLGEVFPSVVTQGFITPTLTFPTACRFVLLWALLVRARVQSPPT